MFGFKKIFFVLVTTILLLGLVATPLTALASPEILKVAVIYEDKDRWMTQVKPSFENENTGVEVKLEVLPWKDLYEKIKVTRAAQPGYYDIEMMASTTPSGKTLGEWYKEISAYAEDLTKYRKNFESAGIDFVEYNGRILGVSLPRKGWMLTISKDSKNKELALKLLKLAVGMPKYVVGQTRQSAIERLRVEVIQPSPNADMLVAYGLQQHLSADAVLQSLLPADDQSSTAPIGQPYSHGDAWFFWVDDQPQAAFAHDTRFVLIDRTTGAIEVTHEEWWPVINGEPYWNAMEIREDSPDIVYQGVYAYENPEGPQASVGFGAEESTQLLYADKFLKPAISNSMNITFANLLASNPNKNKSKNKYAILVCGSAENAFNESIKAMENQLRKDGFSSAKIIKVESPSLIREKDVIKAFDDIVKKIETDKTKNPEFLFYYVGHGNMTNGMVFDVKKKYQVGTQDERIAKGLADTMNYGGSMVIKGDGSTVTSHLAGNLMRIPSKNITVIIDSCKCGTAIKALSGVGLKGIILTATDDNGEMLYWYLGRTDYTAYLLDGVKKREKQKKDASFWWGHNHAAYKTKRYWFYKDPKPQKEELKGEYRMNIIVQGIVIDKHSKKPIQGATIIITGVRVPATQKKTLPPYITDRSGKYNKKLPWWGIFTFKVSAQGYKASQRTLGMDSSALSYDFELERLPLFQDNFNNSGSGWSISTNDEREKTYKSGKYSITVKKPKWQFISWAPRKSFPADFEVKVDARKIVGPTGKYGIIWGKDSDNCYVFTISSDGRYRLRKRANDVWQTNPVSWTNSPAINRGTGSNQLKVNVIGNSITLIVNDAVLTTVKGSSFGTGKIGLVGGSFDDTNVEVQFDNLMILDFSSF